MLQREFPPTRHHVGSHKISLPPVLTEQSCDDRDHITELNSARPKQPFYFLKPTSSILLPGAGPVVRPRGVDLHYEVELALVIGKRLRDFNAKNEQEALDAIESTSSPPPIHAASQTPMRLGVARRAKTSVSRADGTNLTSPQAMRSASI